MSTMKIKKFKAQLISAGGGGVFVRVPFDVEKEYGQKNLIKIKATFDGEAYQGSIANMGDGPCLIILKAIREKIGKQVGDWVEVTVAKDDAPRTVEVPEDLALAFKTHKAEKTYFDGLAYTHKKEYVRWITEAKRPETRTARVEKTILMLQNKRKNPSDK